GRTQESEYFTLSCTKMADGYINDSKPGARQIFTPREYLANSLAVFVLDVAKDDEEKRMFICDLCIYSGMTAINNGYDRSYKYRPKGKRLFEKWQKLTEMYIEDYAPEIIEKEKKEKEREEDEREERFREVLDRAAYEWEQRMERKSESGLMPGRNGRAAASGKERKTRRK
ncbi:MAG: hypothetical protein LUE27_05900, partial [Clostridia bacterium]|nr:hypothetical protein [Clostridia bacterium]